MSTFKYSLQVCSPNNHGQTYHLSRREIIIGSGDVDISIDDPTLSGNHCLIRNTGKDITVTDLQSSNGTFINNKKVLKETTASSGDILTLGSMEFRVIANNEKERLSAVSKPSKKQSEDVFFKRLTSRLLKKDEYKAPYERTSYRTCLLLSLLALLILLGPLLILDNNQLSQNRIQRACSLVRALAATNIEAMKQQNQLMVDTSIISKEPGVSMALVLTNEGIVWAPESLLGKKATDTYGKNSIEAEKLIIQQKPNGILDISMPITDYDYKTGKSSKIGIARIFYDSEQLDQGPNRFFVLAVCWLTFSGLCLLFARRVVNTVKADLLNFQDDCEDIIKGNASLLEEKYSHEFNQLTVTFNRMLRKLGQPQNHTEKKSGIEQTESIRLLINELPQAAICLTSTNMILASNNSARQLLSASGDSLEKKSALELQCEKIFFPQFIEFICNVSQSTKTDRISFTQPDAEVTQAVAIPLEDDLKLILFN